ncbi:hypothetical protein B296_00015306 [Ensete ventricosum]|uniref:Uncharacterized protein n=1 Tax=Ensete ventricosum TaxID=4639 RepID=A0A426YHP4_ENSVE|nr:hypothetical protein B296_00015306 [Ensete ventricosum]
MFVLTRIPCMDEHSRRIWSTCYFLMSIDWFGALGNRLVYQLRVNLMEDGRDQMWSLEGILWVSCFRITITLVAGRSCFLQIACGVLFIN